MSKVRLKSPKAGAPASIDSDGVARYPFWLPCEDGGAVAAWLHRPQQLRRKAAVVLCPPLGFEAVHGHRALRRLADELARAGFFCLRFDYRSTGSSPGDAFDSNQVSGWLRDIAKAALLAAEIAGCRKVSLVGLRMGALLAAEVAAEAVAVDNLVLWAPVRSGRRYLREQLAVAATATTQSALEDAIEAGGFVLSAETMELLGQLKLSDSGYPLSGDALVLERDDLPTGKSLAPKLSHHGVTVTELPATGYAAMMDNPHHSELPLAAIEHIVGWLLERAPAADAPESAIMKPDAIEPPKTRPNATESTATESTATESTATESTATESTATEPTATEPTAEQQRDAAMLHAAGVSVRKHSYTHGGKPLVDELCCIPQARLFGVLTEPRGGFDSARPVVVLSNGGAVHTVGPNRIYVELARGLAAGGYRVFRFDLRNLGDSLVGTPDTENHPYPPTAPDDLRAVMTWLRNHRSARRMVISGLCSGAYTAFHAGLSEQLRGLGLMGVLPINPLTFYWKEGMSLAVQPRVKMVRESKRYRKVLRDPARWLKLLRGQTDLRHSLRFARRWAHKRLSDVLSGPLEALNLRSGSVLSRDLRRVVAGGYKLAFILSEDDAGRDLLMTNAASTVRAMQKSGELKITMIENADHTFTQHAWRQTMIEATRRTLDSWR